MDIKLPLCALVATMSTFCLGKPGWSEPILFGPGDVIDISVLAQPNLSRRYPVRPDGTISMHFVGAITAEGRHPAELEATLEARFAEVFEGTTSVTVDFSQYRPVIVSGEVTRPAAYVFNPGLDVSGALALAGGLLRLETADDANAQMRLAAEASTGAVSQINLAGLMIERARLVAERDQQASFAVPEESRYILGALAADSLGTLQGKLMTVRAEHLNMRINAQGGLSDLAGREAIAFAERRVLLQNEIDDLQEELDGRMELAERGLALLRQILDLRLDADADGADEPEAAALEAAENQKLASANAVKPADVSLQRGDIIERIAAIDSEIAQLRAEIDASRRFVRIFGLGASQLDRVGSSTLYSVRRRRGTELHVLAADPDMLLIPGDVLYVSVGPDVTTPRRMKP